MEKQKNWQFYLIIAVIVLTLYNILPTVFFYSRPLKSPIDAERAQGVAAGIVTRVDNLEEDAKAWLYSFCKLLGIKPTSLELQSDNPRFINLTFQNENDAALFKRFLPKAGSLVPFVPSQLELYPEAPSSVDASKVTVARQINVHLDPQEIDKLFRFVPKHTKEGQIDPAYQDMVFDRAVQLGLAFGGPSSQAGQIEAIVQNPNDNRYDDLAMAIARDIAEVQSVLHETPHLLKRYYANISQINASDKADLMQKFVTRLDSLRQKISTQKDSLAKEIQNQKNQGLIVDPSQEQQVLLLDKQRISLESANGIIRKNIAEFKAAKNPLTAEMLRATLAKSKAKISPQDSLQVVSLEGRNPFVQALVIDWNNDKVELQFYDDVQKILQNENKTEAQSIIHDKVNQLVINDIARASRQADESIQPYDETFAVTLNALTNSSSFLTFDLGFVAQKQSLQLQDQIATLWAPKHPDLARKVYPLYDYNTYKTLKPEEQKLGLVIYAPAMYSAEPPAGFKTESIYVIARGMDAIIQKAQATADAPESKLLTEDLANLSKLMQLNGFIGYPGSSYGMAPEFSKDYIFELDGYYNNLIKATREDFKVKGSKRFAVLDFTDVEQRILTLNQIDDLKQEDLLKWKEEYAAAQVDLNVTSKYQVPYPTKNVYWQNFKINFVKYFRGDDRKVLKWGLDLSGGKTVRIGLLDHNGHAVTNPDDVKQAVNELYTRINKMGVSERTIRIENQNIILDFPGSQNLSASDLVKASAMYFHVVNEKFGRSNPNLKDQVEQFLQGVWNEAVVTNRKDIDSINEIAWQHLGAEVDGAEMRPRSENAKILYESGLRLPNPKEKNASHAFNDTVSTVAMMRGDDFSQWEGQSHPLLFLFHNFALEGSNLTNIQVGFDPTEGNILSFNVKNYYEGSQPGNPRDDFYAWTSQFAEDRIAGTPKEAYSQGRGWRMAVILNGTVISQPALRAALRDGATISGRFSQREINQLAADLKAGSLSFTPRILSEENVSPELGKEERTRGIVASLVALILVVVAMVGYYRFAGVVASCAVLFNILIIWGVLQNLDAAISLPTIAGIVLTIGMAVDANVLVFERIREEFKISGRIASAIQAGYRKAFSAIVDSNVTTIIAAVILIQFDSGPIKGFAVSLIIGIISSMFTALFVTRYFFAGWVQNPKHKSLSMGQFISNTNIDFLAKTKIAVIISLIIMVIGGYVFLQERKTIFGMDFTGGYSLTVNLEEKPGTPSYRLEAINALLSLLYNY